jgi:hypothetical protein
MSLFEMRTRLTNVMPALFCLVLFVLTGSNLYAQENVAPLLYNPPVATHATNSSAAQKTTALTLPFFEDFTSTDFWPDSTKWEDKQVYTNNTMGVNPVSRGVVTFDALTQNGLPYDPNNMTTLRYADSLTSKIIDLAPYQSSDSVYFSFFYQPEGNGFFPETGDSLFLFFRKNNKAWIKVWSKEGTPLQPFKQVMIPIKDPNYFHDTFQFRFVNKVSINTNDDVWNVDYIRIGTGRNMNDTAVNDVAFTRQPSFYLNDYTYMPYRHFLADVVNERAGQLEAAINNNYTNQQAVTYGYTARELVTNQPLSTSGSQNVNIPAASLQLVNFNTYTNLPITPVDKYARVVLENKYYIDPVSGSDPRENDTIIHEQVFDNELAYDDGSAEKSYFLNLYATLPGKTAVQFHLNEDDTLKGVAIYFGRQVPLAYIKYFSIALYSSITVNGNEQAYYQEDFLPDYRGTNNFWVYKLSTPVKLSKGTFYLGTIQPAFSNSDSLYLGLDVNRVGSNHLYYNVLGKWVASTVTGAVMIRPLIGKDVTPSVIRDVIKDVNWTVSPDPADNKIQFHYLGNKAAFYSLTDMQGRTLKKGIARSEEIIDISDLVPGMYLVQLILDGVMTTPQKIIKL